MNPAEFKHEVKEIEGFPPANPVPLPIAYGGTDSKPIVVGSGDARASDKGGEVVDFGAIMGKENVTKYMEVPVETDFFEIAP